MKKTLRRFIIVIMIFTFSLGISVMAASGDFGSHYAEYSSNCWVKLIPITNDTVNGGTAAHQPGGGYDNYAYVRVRIGSSSSTYSQDVEYTYNDEWSGTAEAGWTNSKWAETYHVAQCYTDNTPADYITLTYRPRS